MKTVSKEFANNLYVRARNAEALADRLADTLRRAIKRNPSLSRDEWQAATDLLARWEAVRNA